MLTALIRLSLRFRGLTLSAALILALAGVYAWFQLPIDAFPDISPTQAKLILKVPGMTPEEVEQRVVKPIEQELLSIPNKRVVRSVSKYGIADITIDFEDGADLYWARQQVGERFDYDYDSGTWIRLKPYPLLHLSASRTLYRDWQVRFKVNNLTNQDYTLANGYATAGRSFFVTLTWSPQR